MIGSHSGCRSFAKPAFPHDYALGVTQNVCRKGLLLELQQLFDWDERIARPPRTPPVPPSTLNCRLHEETEPDAV